MIDDEDSLHIIVELLPGLEGMLESYPPERRQSVLVAIGSFAVYYLGKLYGVETAEAFAQLMLDKAADITDDTLGRTWHRA